MSSATPVVAEDRGDVANFVEDGVTGFLVPQGSSQQFLDRLKWLRDNPKERLAMGQAARAKCLREMGLDTFRKQWLEVISP